METFITSLGTIITGVLGWVPSVVNVIVENPLMFFGIGLGVVGVLFTIIFRAVRKK